MRKKIKVIFKSALWVIFLKMLEIIDGNNIDLLVYMNNKAIKVEEELDKTFNNEPGQIC